MFFDMQQMAIERVSSLFSIYHERNSVPLFRRCFTFICIGLPTKKGHKRGGYAGEASPKGDGMFANRTPFASINQRIALK